MAFSSARRPRATNYADSSARLWMVRRGRRRRAISDRRSARSGQVRIRCAPPSIRRHSDSATACTETDPGTRSAVEQHRPRCRRIQHRCRPTCVRWHCPNTRGAGRTAARRRGHRRGIARAEQDVRRSHSAGCRLPSATAPAGLSEDWRPDPSAAVCTGRKAPQGRGHMMAVKGGQSDVKNLRQQRMY